MEVVVKNVGEASQEAVARYHGDKPGLYLIFKCQDCFASGHSTWCSRWQGCTTLTTNMTEGTLRVLVIIHRFYIWQLPERMRNFIAEESPPSLPTHLHAPRPHSAHSQLLRPVAPQHPWPLPREAQPATPSEEPKGLTFSC